ncbi:MAG: hypothetical protein M3R09_06710, partial [Actinomycetota bacterium]|nr:hypothetical protein [Actinomycetota bacterium]
MSPEDQSVVSPDRRQSFFFGPGDAQAVAPFLTRDPNATLVVVSGAWA